MLICLVITLVGLFVIYIDLLFIIVNVVIDRRFIVIVIAIIVVAILLHAIIIINVYGFILPMSILILCLL